MTEQEIEKLRDKLGSDYSVKRQNGAITVELVDIWKGVEFSDFKGSVFKIDKFDGLTFYENGWSISKYDCKPSTEAAYIEQLKTKAHELYGEIKNGDRFVRGFHSPYNDILEFTVYSPKGYSYDIINDALLIDDMWVYHKGKWAEKLKSRVSVEVEDWVSTTNAEFESFDFSVKMRVKPLRPFDPNESAVYLAKCLEEYLNKS